jgi:hypothetical protein
MWGQKKIGESRAGEKNSEWIAGNISAIQFVLAPTFKKSQSTPSPPGKSIGLLGETIAG